MEATPGGIDLHLLSEDDRKKLKRKIERRRRRGRFVSRPMPYRIKSPESGRGVVQNSTNQTASELDGSVTTSIGGSWRRFLLR